MVQTIICRNWREGGGLSSGSGLGVVFSTNSLLDLVLVLCIKTLTALTERNKTQQRCLVCGFWLLGSGFGDLKCDPLTPAQTLTVEMHIIIKINPWRPNAVHRQIHEACLIWQRARQKRVTVLNSKSMFNRCSLKRLVLEDSNSEAQNDNGLRRDMNGDQREDGESNAIGSLNSNISVNNRNTLMGKTGSRKRKQTDGQTGRIADIRSFMQKSKERDKVEE